MSQKLAFTAIRLGKCEYDPNINEERGNPEATSTGVNWLTPLKGGLTDRSIDALVRLKICSAATVTLGPGDSHM